MKRELRKKYRKLSPAVRRFMATRLRSKNTSLAAERDTEIINYRNINRWTRTIVITKKARKEILKTVHSGHAKNIAPSSIWWEMPGSWNARSLTNTFTYAERKNTDFRETHGEEKNVNALVRGSSILTPASMTRSRSRRTHRGYGAQCSTKHAAPLQR